MLIDEGILVLIVAQEFSDSIEIDVGDRDAVLAVAFTSNGEYLVSGERERRSSSVASERRRTSSDDGNGTQRFEYCCLQGWQIHRSGVILGCVSLGRDDLRPSLSMRFIVNRPSGTSISHRTRLDSSLPMAGMTRPRFGTSQRTEKCGHSTMASGSK